MNNKTCYRKHPILSVSFFLALSFVFSTSAWSERVVVAYDPRTGISTLGTGRNKMKVLTKNIEKLLSTAKQISIDEKGRITAILDLDMDKVKGKATGKSSSSQTNSKTPEIIVISPLGNGQVSQSALKIEGVVANRNYSRMDIGVKNGGVSKKYRARVKSNGEFNLKVKLLEGENVITLRSRSKAGKKYEQSFKIVYFP